MYTAVSVCTTKLIRLRTRKKAAYVYFFLVADAEAPSKSGLLLRNVDRLAANGGRALPFGESYEGLPRSSFSRGVNERPSVGLCNGGLSAMLSSSSSSSLFNSVSKCSSDDFRPASGLPRSPPRSLVAPRSLPWPSPITGERRRDGGFGE